MDIQVRENRPPEKKVVKPQRKEDDLAVVVDDNGRLQAQFVGDFAKQDAQEHLRECKAGGVRHLTRAVVVTGDDAKKAVVRGRI